MLVAACTFLYTCIYLPLAPYLKAASSTLSVIYFFFGSFFSSFFSSIFSSFFSSYKHHRVSAGKTSPTQLFTFLGGRTLPFSSGAASSCLASFSTGVAAAPSCLLSSSRLRLRSFSRALRATWASLLVEVWEV